MNLEGIRQFAESERARRAARWVVLPLLVYIVAVVVITWPLAGRMQSHIAGAAYGDSYMMARQAWAAREALLDGRNPLDQTLLAYPDGFTSRLQWSTPLRYIPTMILAFAFPPVMAFNLALLGTLVLNGMAAYWLGMELIGGRNAPSALLGGLVFMAFPSMQGHLSVGHIDVLAAWPLPLLALCLWRIVRRDAGWRTVIWGAVWLMLASLGLTSLLIYHVMPVVLFFGLYHLLWARDRLAHHEVTWWWEQPWSKVTVMIVLGGIMLLPFFAPLLTAAGRAEIGDLRETGRVDFSADPLTFVSPSPFGPLDDVGLVPDYARDVLGVNATEGAAYLGVVALALVVFALARRSEARPWLAVALGAMVLSLGPLLKWHDDPVVFRVEDIDSYVTLPWATFQDLPVLESTRTPGRFNGATALAWSALVSVGAGVVLLRFRRREARIGLAVLLGVLILVEYRLFAPFLTVDARLPDYFDDLADQDVRAVLDVPVTDPLVTMQAMNQQMTHGKPLIGGQVMRRTPQDPAVLAVLDRAATSDAVDGLPAIRRQDVPYLLSAAGADRVIVHKLAYADAAPVVDRLRSIFGAPDYEDERIAAFVVPRTPEPPPGFTLAGAVGTAGWSDPVDVGDFVGPFLADAGDWHFFTAAEVYGDLFFRIAPYRIRRPIRIWLDDHLIAGWWGGAGTFRLPLWLEPGFHTLHFEAVGGCTDYPFALTCWDSPSLAGDCAPLDPPVCISAAFEPPVWRPASAPPEPLGVELDGGLRLRAYEVTLAPDDIAIRVRLFWESDGSLPDSYALFVHVADPATDIPISDPATGAQVAYNGYPLVLTDAWGDGARWQSDVEIALPEGLGGEVAINVGWFREFDQMRLGVRGDDPRAAAGLIHLATVSVGDRLR